MKQAYNNISITSGAYAAGIFKIQIAPREWLQYDIVPDFTTGKVLNEVLLTDNKSFIKLSFTPDSYQFDEKPKNTKAGTYFEIKFEGIINNITPEILLTLETLRNHELVAILHDKQRRKKVIGNQAAGLIFQYSNQEDAKNGGVQICAVSLMMDSEAITPFYEP